MRIAQIAPLYERVPPLAYGATERIVHYLTEALVASGHDVTLFASGDSVTSARLVACCESALWRDERVEDTLGHHVHLLERVAQRAAEFDVLHFHCEPLHLPLARRLDTRCVTTMHGLLREPDVGALLRAFSDAPLVSISASQRRAMPFANWRATIHHGLPADAFDLCTSPGDYLLWMGRMMRGKRPDLAIEIARRAGLPLKMAAAVHPGERAYFADDIAPLIESSAGFVEYLGEVGGDARTELLRHARALLFPIDWDEPFGMVMIEAFACGTPVVAFRRGAVPEVVEDGVSGFVVDDLDGAVRAVERIDEFDRRRCRAAFDARFTAERMARDYLRVYRSLARGAERDTDLQSSSPQPAAR
ncbi:glycosyltransferase involved in cell wall biosynthesis [Paraburkholderia caballeronis]|uniref:glycosyltransferase family 4 protein n=1 Tax=Paraburkholderia caballeronis TaxID=416943 RepID=UPI001066B764|nr:glycosyltransferase family 4 protein [Paraburkholderia caballeronis]TDV35728.1 glycosyltransferase involved in cell wall biosynthesis [Paraburkholderia caballeronis]